MDSFAGTPWGGCKHLGSKFNQLYRWRPALYYTTSGRKWRWQLLKHRTRRTGTKPFYKHHRHGCTKSDPTHAGGNTQEAIHYQAHSNQTEEGSELSWTQQVLQLRHWCGINKPLTFSSQVWIIQLQDRIPRLQSTLGEQEQWNILKYTHCTTPSTAPRLQMLHWRCQTWTR